MDWKIEENQPVFVKTKETGLDQFFWFAENLLVTISKIQILRNFENPKTGKQVKTERLIIFHSIFEFWIEKRLKTDQTERLTGFCL
jgi:hypothetical protein